MSVSAWGSGEIRPRCAFHKVRKRNGKLVAVQCRVDAVIAIQHGRYKNGNWNRPYPSCQGCRGKWKPRWKFTEQREVSLTDYVSWLKGETALGSYLRGTYAK